MLKSLSIQNFQSHKDSTLEFDEGVNVIVGSSDSGKTAIIRALRWLRFNRPSGDSIRSNWGGKTRVELFTDDSHIVRSKDKEDEYVLGDTHFKAFNKDVPKEIQDALNMSETNIQSQFDSSFLLSESPGNVAAHFNKVARLDKIDTGLQNVQKAIRELEQTIKYKGEQLTTQEESLQSYLHLDKFEAEVEVLESMENALQSKESSKKRLEGYIIDYKDNQESLQELEDIVSGEKKVNEILQYREDRAEVDVKQVKLERLINKIKEALDAIREQEQILLLEEQVDSLLQLFEERKALGDDKHKIYILVRKISNVSKDKETNDNYLKERMEEFNREMPDVCPLCGSKIPHNHEKI